MGIFSSELLFCIIGVAALFTIPVVCLLQSNRATRKKIMNAVPDAVLLLGRSGDIQDINAPACTLLGVSRGDALSRSATELMKSSLGIELEVLVREHCTISVPSHQGAASHYTIHIKPFDGRARPDPAERIVFIRDITQMRNTQRAIDFIDKHDRATGLPNGAYMIQNLEERLLEAPRGKEVVVVMISIDTGVEQGVVFSLTDMDFLVGETASRIRDSLPEGSFLARTASGELCVLLEAKGMVEGEILAEIRRIQTKLAHPVLLFGKKLSGSFSMGYTMSAVHGTDPQELISKAVIAMSVARVQSPGSIMRYEEKMSEEIERKFDLAQHIGDAIANDELFVEYQPLMSREGSLVGAECLLRWRRPEGLIPPDVFIPIAEEKNIIQEIGLWVLEQACMQISALLAMDVTDVRLTVNVSVLQLYDSSFSAKVEAIVKRYKVPGELLELEITENMAINYDHNVSDNLDAITNMGIRVSIDDFGMGCTSLMYITRLPLKTIKLDKSLAQNVSTNEKFSAIVNSIVLLCSELDIELIAECVETQEQYEALENMGVEVYQGWYFSKPLPKQEFLRFVSEKHQRLVSAE